MYPIVPAAQGENTFTCTDRPVSARALARDKIGTRARRGPEMHSELSAPRASMFSWSRACFAPILDPTIVAHDVQSSGATGFEAAQRSAAQHPTEPLILCALCQP